MTLNAQPLSGKQYLVAHIIHRLQVGGLENGLVNLINNMSDARYKHIIICMTEFTDFKNRLNSNSVTCYALHKKEGKDISVYFRLWKLLMRVQPDIIHTRNIGTIDCVIPAFFAGVKHRVHGEHGRDMADIDGSNRRYITLRKLMSPFIQRFIALSQDLQQWLLNTVKISEAKITQIYNGVDLEKFKPRDSVHDNSGILFGTVGRLNGEKDQLTLVNAFIQLLAHRPEKRGHLKLIIIGEGPLEERLKAVVSQYNVEDAVIFTGAKNDVTKFLQEMDVFILPSLGEGISNTILEAMASGLPVIATKVGGNPELVEHDKTGFLVPANNPEEMATAMNCYIEHCDLMEKHGSSGRQRVETLFSMENMVERYVRVYDELIPIKQ